MGSRMFLKLGIQEFKYFIDNAFLRIESEPTLYMKREYNDILIICLYVGDWIFRGCSFMMDFKQAMMNKFEMADIGYMDYFRGLVVR